MRHTGWSLNNNGLINANGFNNSRRKEIMRDVKISYYSCQSHKCFHGGWIAKLPYFLMHFAGPDDRPYSVKSYMPSGFLYNFHSPFSGKLRNTN